MEDRRDKDITLFNPGPLEAAFTKLKEGAENTEDGEMSNPGEDAEAAMALVRDAHDETTKLLYAHMRSLAEQQEARVRADATAKHHKEMVGIYQKNIEEHNARWKKLNEAQMRVSELDARLKEMSLENNKLTRLLEQQCICRRFRMERERLQDSRASTAESFVDVDLCFDEQYKNMVAMKERSDTQGHRMYMHLKLSMRESIYTENEGEFDTLAKQVITDGLMEINPRTGVVADFIAKANEIVQNQKLVYEQARVAREMTPRELL